MDILRRYIATNYLTLIELALQNQVLIARSLDMGLVGHARMLMRLDKKLIWLLKQDEYLSEAQQRAQGFTHYIWRTAGDDKVRPSHAANDGQIFSWDDPPPTGHPGEDYGCRCWAQPLDGAESVYPLETLLVGLGTSAGRAILREILRRVGRSGGGGEDVVEEKPRDILNPSGQPIGTPGDRPQYREHDGGNEAAQELYNKLKEGGTPDTPRNYPGEGTRLPNGDWVGYRPTSRSGPPTIDLDIEGEPIRKIKFPE